MGYGEAKQAVFDAAMNYFADARTKRIELAAKPSDVEDVLRAGAKRARETGREVLDRVRAACGLGTRSRS